jgi:hypothetical protein
MAVAVFSMIAFSFSSVPDDPVKPLHSDAVSLHPARGAAEADPCTRQHGVDLMDVLSLMLMPHWATIPSAAIPGCLSMKSKI